MLNIELKGVDKALEKLKDIPKGVEKAASSAINKTARGARTYASRAISKNYNVKVGDVRKTFDLRKSSRKSLTAELISTGGVIPLSKYKVLPRAIQRKGRHNRPLRVAVKRGSGAKTIKGAFLTQFQSGHMAVVNRKGKKRFPVVERYGPSIPQMFKADEVKDPVVKDTEERLNKEFAHEVDRVLAGIGGAK